MEGRHLQRNTTTAWYETKHDLILTCDTNDQAKQCNSTRHIISGVISAGNRGHQNRHMNRKE